MLQTWRKWQTLTDLTGMKDNRLYMRNRRDRRDRHDRRDRSGRHDRHDNPVRHDRHDRQTYVAEMTVCSMGCICVCNKVCSICWVSCQVSHNSPLSHLCVPNHICLFVCQLEHRGNSRHPDGQTDSLTVYVVSTCSWSVILTGRLPLLSFLNGPSDFILLSDIVDIICTQNVWT